LSTALKNLGFIESLKALGYLDFIYRIGLAISVGFYFEIEGSRSRDSKVTSRGNFSQNGAI
jgi:hypothetical protein